MYRLWIDHEATQTIKKSQFITYLHRCFSEQEAKDFVNTIRKKHPDATHHCYAFITENAQIQRSNDDGEPHGTAGVPMLEVLKVNEVSDICAVVVRYFGGILLGAGGLVRAYSSSVALALKEAKLTHMVKMRRYEINFTYDLIGKIDYLFETHNIQVLNKIYDEQVTYIFHSKTNDIENKLQELTSGRYPAIFIEEEIIEEIC